MMKEITDEHLKTLRPSTQLIYKHIIRLEHDYPGKQLSEIPDHEFKELRNQLSVFAEEEKGRKTYKPWTEEEMDYLRANYKNGDVVEMSIELDRDEETIRIKARQLGLRRYRRTNSLWMDDMITYLKDNYQQADDLQEIAEHLGLTKTQVKSKASELRLGRSRRRMSKRRRKRLKFVEQNMNSMTTPELAEHLGVSTVTINTDKREIKGGKDD